MRAAGVRHAVGGGYAVALHGAVRGTLDIDVVLRWSRASLVQAEAALNGIGLASRLPVTAQDAYGFRDECVENRNLAARNFCNPDAPLEQADIVVAYELTAKRTYLSALERLMVIEDQPAWSPHLRSRARLASS